MDDPYALSFERVKRANVHIGSLKRALRVFKAKAYEIDTDIDIKTQDIIIYGTPIADPPTHKFGMMIGDIANNLRAALDNLVWALTDQFSGPPPPNPIPSGDKWRQVRFPIVVDPAKWPTNKPIYSLCGIDPRLVSEFKKLQPFDRRQSDPERDEFRVLDELWNIDKHRSPHLTHVFIGLDHIGEARWPHRIAAPPRFTKNMRFEVVEQRRLGPLERRAELGRVRIMRETLVVTSALTAKNYVDPVLTFDIAFEKGAPAYGGRVVSTLERLRDAVTEALVRFEPEFR